MRPITLAAHFDGQQIRLDEPFELQPGARLIVAVVVNDSLENERQLWLAASQSALAAAYGDDEPDYSDAVLRETSSKQ